MIIEAFTKEQLELQAYIEKSNEESRKNAEAKGYQIIGEMVSDPAHWAQYGVTNIEEYRYERASSDYSDFYKEVNGFRPRGRNMTLPELEYEIKQLEKQVEAEEEELFESTMSDEEVKEAYEKSEDEKAVARKEANKYQPNHAFAGLGDMLK